MKCLRSKNFIFVFGVLNGSSCLLFVSFLILYLCAWFNSHGDWTKWSCHMFRRSCVQTSGDKLCCLRVFILVLSPAHCGLVPSSMLRSVPFIPLPVHYSLVQPARSWKQLPVNQRMVKSVLVKRILLFPVGPYTHLQPTFGDEQS